MELYRYKLDKTRGKKYCCPSCGDKKSFRRYIDTETGKEIGDDCGKCDHENNCKYHKPPREWFAEHPQAKEDWLKKHSLQSDWAKRGQALLAEKKAEQAAKVEAERKARTPPELWTLPLHLAEVYHSPGSNFVRWLKDVVKHFDIDRTLANQVYEDYRLGADNLGRVIFWQIDREQRLRTGKVMQYSETGHRTGNPTWMHVAEEMSGRLPVGWELRQCLFGEHLLSRYPKRKVCIVESEKTAVICSLLHSVSKNRKDLSDQLWLATGGCGALSAEKMAVLKGRKVTLYPDSGSFQKWKKVAMQRGDIDCNVLSSLESYPPNTDIADVLLGEV